MERSPERAQAAALTMSFPESNCLVCNEKMSQGQNCLLISECQHAFHQNCIESYLSHSSTCPSCSKTCSLAGLKKISIQNHPPPLTKSSLGSRGRARGAISKQNIPKDVTPVVTTENPHLPENNNNNLMELREQAAYIDQQNNNVAGLLIGDKNSGANNSFQGNQENSVDNSRIGSPTVDYSKIDRLIEEKFTRLLQHLNLVPNSQPGSEASPPSQRQTQPPGRPNNNQPNSPFQQNNRFQVNNNIHSSTHQMEENVSHFDENFAIRSTKITSIIQNWNIKFDGSANGISVDEFLYRVSSLTREHFNNDFNIICKNLHVLLSGRARNWYWGYHKQVQIVEWKGFCEALQYRYKDFRSSFDIHDEVRNRKMKPNETFEIFFESVSAMLDRLDTPIPEADLVEILKRNLRPEIRHELLYVPIYSIAHLRKLVQMRENLLGDEYYRKNLPIKIPPNYGLRRQVAEVEYPGEHEIPDSSLPTNISVDAIQQSSTPVKCWNCSQIGHHWEDCLESRNIFCYGCGEKDTLSRNVRSAVLEN